MYYVKDGFYISQDLEAKLQEVRDARMKLIVTDGVFSMDGNVAPLPEICALAEKYNAMVFVDECHATGFFGKTGRFDRCLVPFNCPYLMSCSFWDIPFEIVGENF